MARLLFLGASVSQLPAIRLAKADGHAVVACDGDPHAVAFPLCDVAAVVDFSDVDAVTAVAQRESVDGVLAICTDRAVVPAAAVAARLGLPGLPLRVAQAMTHKPTMRARLALAGIPQPRSRTLGSETDVETLRSMPLPAVLKPADSGGQRGLRRIGRFEEIETALPETLAASRTGEAILEEYVEGDEVNTLFVVRDGVPTLITISDRLRPGGDGFGVGWIHLFPSSLPVERQREVERTAAAAIRALGMRDGIAFPQLLVTRSGVVLVEVAARIAAGQMADLVRHATGIDLYAVAVKQALGLAVPDDDVTARAARPIAIRFFTASPGSLPVGTVRSISGLEQVRAAAGVLDAGLYFGPGDEVGPLRVDADRRGYVIATGSTPKTALRRADAAARRLHVRVEPRPRRSLPLRPLRLLTPTVAAALVAVIVGAFVVSGHSNLQRPLLGGARVSAAFSPVCGCGQRVAHIAFHLLRKTTVGVDVLDSSGKAVARVLRPESLSARVVRLAWNGRNGDGRVEPSGRYYPEVVLPRVHRDVRLPGPIVLDTVRPSVERASLHARDGWVVVRYAFSEPAHAELELDGRPVVRTRSGPASGILRWRERTPVGHHGLSLVAVDPAGNRSLPLVVGT